jgi:hypothetical protein
VDFDDCVFCLCLVLAKSHASFCIRVLMNEYME